MRWSMIQRSRLIDGQSDDEDDLYNDPVGAIWIINAITIDDQEDSIEDLIKYGCSIGGLVLRQASKVKIVF